MPINDTSDYYTAAVVEYSSVYVKNDAKSTLMKNAEVFANYIEQASKQVSSIDCYCYNFYNKSN